MHDRLVHVEAEEAFQFGSVQCEQEGTEWDVEGLGHRLEIYAHEHVPGPELRDLLVPG